MKIAGAAGARNIGQYGIVGCLAAATLGFELVQTRILSALYYNHVVYLTVTIALMGFGISGVVVSLLARGNMFSARHIAFASAAFALAMVFSIATASRLPMWFPGAPVTSKLMLSYLLLMIPFLCSGTAIGLIFMRGGSDIFRLYCFDLVASAFACAAFILLLNPLGAGGFIWACVALACIAFALQAREAKMNHVGILALIFLLLVIAFSYGSRIVNNQPEPYKTLGTNMRHPGAHLVATEWTPITRLDLMALPWDRERWMILSQDSDAYTPFFPASKIQGTVEMAKRGGVSWGAVNLGYIMHKAPPDESLVIGVGGGIDIVTSYAYRAKHTTGVEINPVTVELATKRFADFLGWPHLPNIDIVVEEGRHFIRSRSNMYDIVTMSGIDTFSALNSGAYVLSENYLYTTEAFEDYLNALKPDGIMTINRWFEAIPPRESLRLVSLQVEAAHRMGIEHPEQTVFVVATTRAWRASTFIKKTPFTQDEINRALTALEKSDAKVIYLPKIFPPDQQKAIEERLAKSRDGGLNIANDAYEHVINPPSAEAKADFLKKYPLDVSPVYDDRPFFFEYHKDLSLKHWGEEMYSVRRSHAQDNLYWLFCICTLVSVTAMIAPLVIFNRQGLRTAGMPWLMLYFSCLGIGFMMVEIGMMQRLSLYLGDPMHALLVVLSGLLLFAGVGAYLSGRRQLPPDSLFKLGTLGSMGIILVWLLLMPLVISWTQTFPFIVRAILTDLSIMPVGLIMGIPFATGLSHLESASPRFIPWAWGVNGLTSVLASILAIILAMRIGFTMVLVLGALTYFLGYVAIKLYQRSSIMNTP